MNIKVNDKVLIASADPLYNSYNSKIAVVKRIYSEVNPPIAYVEIEENLAIASTVGFKVPLADLVSFEPKSDIPEGAREITKDDVVEALKAITSPKRIFSNDKTYPAKGFIAGIRTMIVARNVSEKLFENQSSITVTEDQFIDALWNACSPVDVSRSIDKMMSVRNCVHISSAVMLDLLDIVPIFFGESEK